MSTFSKIINLFIVLYVFAILAIESFAGYTFEELGFDPTWWIVFLLVSIFAEVAWYRAYVNRKDDKKQD